VFLFLFLPKRDLSAKTHLFVGTASGLAFGAAEAVPYSTLYSQLLPDMSSAAPVIGQEIWRLVTDSILHACMTGIAAYFIGLAPAARRLAVPLVSVGLLLAAMLHGTYDTVASSWAGFFMAYVIVCVFVSYVSTGDEIEKRFRDNEGEAQLGKSAEGT
jgi:RsiW-degrading membrane proteinase PrsW (M82 family)